MIDFTDEKIGSHTVEKETGFFTAPYTGWHRVDPYTGWHRVDPYTGWHRVDPSTGWHRVYGERTDNG